VRRWIALASLAVASALLLAACGGDEEGGVETFEDPSAIEVDAGQEFAIVLDSNPTTGYAWEMAKDPDPKLAEFVGSEYEADPGSEDREGGGGKETLTFRAGEPGEGTLHLEYVFSGGDEQSATKRKIALTVR